MERGQLEKLVEKFYKECGQYCGDVHGQIGDWWLKEIRSLLSQRDIELYSILESKRMIFDPENMQGMFQDPSAVDGVE